MRTRATTRTMTTTGLKAEAQAEAIHQATTTALHAVVVMVVQTTEQVT